MKRSLGYVIIVAAAACIFVINMGFAYFLSKRQQSSIHLKQTKNRETTVSYPNKVRIDQHGNTILYSQDGTETLIYSGADPSNDVSFSAVSEYNTTTHASRSASLVGPLPYARGPLFLSPRNNKLYFTHTVDGVGIYEVWESDIDGNNAVRIVGIDHDKTNLQLSEQTPVGVETDFIDYSPDGMWITTGKIVPLAKPTIEVWIFKSDGTNIKKIFSSTKYKQIASLQWATNNQITAYFVLPNKQKIKHTFSISK